MGTGSDLAARRSPPRFQLLRASAALGRERHSREVAFCVSLHPRRLLNHDNDNDNKNDNNNDNNNDDNDDSNDNDNADTNRFIIVTVILLIRLVIVMRRRRPLARGERSCRGRRPPPLCPTAQSASRAAGRAAGDSVGRGAAPGGLLDDVFVSTRIEYF